MWLIQGLVAIGLAILIYYVVGELGVPILVRIAWGVTAGITAILVLRKV